LSTQHPQATPALPAAGAPQTRASDADRDAAAALLGAAFAEGRLTADEHGERLSAAYAARSWQQLRQLTADLPGTAGTTEPTAAPAMAAGPDPCLLCLLLIVCPPAGIAWWLLSRRRPGADPDGQLTAASRPAVTAEPPLSGRAGTR
jgi:pyruvate/2-oxoglutarate dehydrogenase complex dihydrolipoamide acyltransferase (E2) component